ncbi:MAG: glycosyltransferase [Rhodospirillaceae bacterium]
MTAAGREPVAVLYKAKSEFDSLNTMVDHWAAALRRKGFRPEIVDLRAADAVARAVALIRGERVALFLSLNGFGVPTPGQGPGFYQECAAPLFIHFVDHPAYHHTTLCSEAPHLVATFPTPSHLRFCRTHIRGNLPLLHLPHAAEPDPVAPWRERDLPLLLAGSLHEDPEAKRAGWSRYGPVVRDRLEAILAGHRAAPRRPLHDIVLEALNRPEPDLEAVRSHFGVVDGYLRSRVRLEFVQAAAAHRLPLTVIGRGWDGAVPAGSTVRLEGERPVSEVFAAMARTRIVLNLLPPYYESHERPFQAMAHGAVAATVAAPWLVSAVGAESLLALPPDAAEAAATAGAALAGDAALEARAAAGTTAFLAGHTWDHRLERVLSWIKSVKPGSLSG